MTRASVLSRSAVCGLLVLAAATGAATTSTGAAASPAGAAFVVSPPVQVNGASGLTACPSGSSRNFAAAYDHAEVEPQVAVNPLDPREIVGVAQQDRWPDGGARGLSSWRTGDGGATWGRLDDVPWSACQGGPERFGRVTDPWVSYDKAGNLYFIGQPLGFGSPGISAMSVTTFDRAEQRWMSPQVLIEDSDERFVFNDKVSVTGDPTRAGYAYATWLRVDVPAGQRQAPTADRHSFAYRGQPMLSRTTDGGQTWSQPTAMRESNSFFLGDQIAVGRDGTLYNVVANLFTGAGIQPNEEGVYMGVMRSRDAGLHWSAPVQIAPIRTAQLTVPDDGFPIRAGDFWPDIAVDPVTGDLHVVWSDGLGTDVNRAVLVTSRDGGRHWTEPSVVSTGGPRAQAYNPTVEVTPDGTLVLMYYDDRNNALGDGVATTDIWLRHSHDGGRTWEPEQHPYGPFDHYTAPVSFFAPDEPRGLFLGDYMGLEAVGSNDVLAFFTSTDLDGADVWAVRADHP